MSVWETINQFPDYEITREGDIRHKTELEAPQTYLGRSKKYTEIHYRVRLVRNGITYPVSVGDLIKNAFPPKPKLKATRKRLPNRAVDGTNLSGATWRTIPGFSLYQITPDGYVRNRETQKVLACHKNDIYTLVNNYGQKTSRVKKSLVALAYPQDEWRPVKDCPGYMVNINGEVMGPRHKILPLTKKNAGTVRVRKNGKAIYLHIADAAFEAFGEYEIKDAA